MGELIFGRPGSPAHKHQLSFQHPGIATILSSLKKCSAYSQSARTLKHSSAEHPSAQTAAIAHR